jgi:hypothetical protein
MRQAVLFLSRFLLSLWIVLVSAFLLLLLRNAPSVPNTPFASLSIRTEQNSTVHLPNRIFTCTETGQQFQCQAELQDRLLALRLTKGKDYKYDFSNCRAEYGGRSVECKVTGLTHAPILAQIYEIKNLGLSSQQIQAIRQEYWSMNVLVRLGELRLLWISTGLSLAAGISAALFTCLHPGNLSKSFASFACGVGMYQLIGGWLGRVPYTLVTPYGLTPESWGSVVNGSAIVTGVITMLTTALLLWSSLNRFSKSLLSLSTGAAIFSLCRESLTWNSNQLLNLLDLSDAFSQQGYSYLIMQIIQVVSILLAVAAAILLWRRTNQSIQRFLCLGCGFGAIALATNLLLSLLLGLGYVD